MRRRELTRTLALLSALPALGLAGCASMTESNQQRQVASLLNYLYPNQKEPPPPPADVAEIRVPFRVGVAFAPDTNPAKSRLSEADRQQLASRVRDAFANYPFVSRIETVPSIYLEARGGFDNLQRTATLLNLDVIALISYDLVQHADASGWSFLYWTGVGAYVIKGDRYEVLTAVECSVLDVRSRRMLMHAGGTSIQKGEATLVGFGEQAREGRLRSFQDATEQMIGALQTEVRSFRERAPKDPGIRLILPPGYDAQGSGTR
jgi:rhombotail lipoprotein